MDIKLVPDGNGQVFTFPALPEKIQGKYGAKYQSFDIISQGTVKIPKGTDVSEFSWDGVFFGGSKKNEPVVRKNSWKEPAECVSILTGFLKNETVLTLIVTDTFINVDVTLASFQPRVTGAYGNIGYSVSFIQLKPLRLYTTDELKSMKKTRARNGGGTAGGSYTVAGGDTLWSIAAKKLGSGSKWSLLYDANAAAIEAAAVEHGMVNSDRGHWIWPGEVLVIPG